LALTPSGAITLTLMPTPSKPMQELALVNYDIVTTSGIPVRPPADVFPTAAHLSVVMTFSDVMTHRATDRPTRTQAFRPREVTIGGGTPALTTQRQASV
jgi:hypothetical protein